MRLNSLLIFSFLPCACENRMTIFYLFGRILYIFWIKPLCQIYVFQISLPVCSSLFYYLIGAFWWIEILNFNEVQFLMFLTGNVFCVHLRKLCILQGHEMFFCLLDVLCLLFMYRPMIYLKLIFVYGMS